MGLKQTWRFESEQPWELPGMGTATSSRRWDLYSKSEESSWKKWWFYGIYWDDNGISWGIGI
jgi:hypothetical protein